jgi:hypothetical protein
MCSTSASHSHEYAHMLTNKLEQDERAAAIKTLQSHALLANERSSNPSGADGGTYSARLRAASLSLVMQEQSLFALNVLSDSMVQPRQALTISFSQVQAEHLVLDLYFVRQLAAALEETPTVDAHGRLRWRVWDDRYSGRQTLKSWERPKLHT